MSDSEENDEYDPTISRGTASAGNPLVGSADTDREEEQYIKIDDPNTSEVRLYRLTNDIRKRYETMYEVQLDRIGCEWYEMWWEGRKLAIKYEGPARTPEMRHNKEMPPAPPEQNVSAEGGRGIGIFVFGGPAFTVDIDEITDNDVEEFNFDKGIHSIVNFVKFDIQRRADERPLAVEDLFIAPWDDDEKAPEPTKTLTGGEKQTREVEFYDERKPARGENWNI